MFVRLVVVAALLAALGAGPAGKNTTLPLLPWHEARLDGDGRLLAWYHPERGLGYDRVLRLGWGFLERGVPVDRRAGVKVYLAYSVIEPRTRQGQYWQHNPAFLNASLVDSLASWYAYSADRRAVRTVRMMLDYQLAHGTSPRGWKWAGVPFATSCGGDRRYGRCLYDVPKSFYGGVETDKVGLLGLSYVRFYELTGERRYLRAGIRAADTLAHHVRPGDARRTPWPFRVDGRTGRTLAGAEYGGLVAGPVALFDELLRLRAGRLRAYARARKLAWDWVLGYPLRDGSGAFNNWSGFYEDAPYNRASRNQVLPTLTAYYLLSRTSPGAVDPAWRAHVAELLRWTRATFGRGPFFGAWGIDEGGVPGRFCCSRAGLGSDTSRWAAVSALFAARTGDAAAREDAFRSLNYATYFARSDGLVSCCGVRRTGEYWFSDGYGDYLRSFSWAMAALPELAPEGRDHLLGSTSVVQSVTYGRGRIAYRTFDSRSREVLRLSFQPARVLANGRSLPRSAAGDGYDVGPLPGGDFEVYVRHQSSRRIEVEGSAIKKA